jgi:hypothetical protein
VAAEFAFEESTALLTGAAATGTLVGVFAGGASLVAEFVSVALSGAAEAVFDDSAVFFASSFFLFADESLFFFFSDLAVFFGSLFTSDLTAASSLPLLGATLLTLSGACVACPSLVCVRAARLGTIVAKTMAVRDKTFFMVHSNF